MPFCTQTHNITTFLPDPTVALTKLKVAAAIPCLPSSSLSPDDTDSADAGSERDVGWKSLPPLLFTMPDLWLSLILLLNGDDIADTNDGYVN